MNSPDGVAQWQWPSLGIAISLQQNNSSVNHLADWANEQVINHSRQGGKDPTKTSSSASVLLTTLIPVFVVAALQLVGFFLLRRTNRHLYAPRTILSTLDDEERLPSAQKNGWFNWIPDFLKLEDESLLEKHSLDAYLFLRFLKMVILICFIGMCMTWTILFPINVTGGGKSKELDRLTIGNVKDPRRYYAHLFVAIVFLTFVMFTITRETLYYINLRQAYLLTPWNASRVSSRTVLFTSIPERQLDETHLRRVLNNVKTVWIVQDCSKIKTITAKRANYAKKLEAALVKATVSAVKDHSKSTNRDAELDDHHDGRPTVRQLPIFGVQQDSIKLYAENLVKTDAEVDLAQTQARHGNAKVAGGAFVEFESISAAQNAFQTMAHQTPFVMIPRSIATTPHDVLWENISIPAWETVLRGIASVVFIIVLILFWSIPTSFIGILSNVSQLANEFKWLNWINDLPTPVLDAIEGLLPSLLLSTLVSYVPLICRYIATLSGETTKAHVELKTQEWYFAFQVIQVFLVTTFASGATAVTADLINDPKKAPELLAKRLPKASNFYLSYFIIYGFGQSTKNLLNWSGLFFDKVFSLLDKTPRAKFDRFVSLSGTGWGSWYPKFTNLAIIAISYSCIAPLTLGFATVAFAFLYLVFKYNLFYVLRTSIDTQGRAYAKALQQLTVGIYTTEFCLIGLFSISAKRQHSSSGPLIIMVIFTVLTIVYHRIMHRELNTLTKTLPNNIVREREDLQNRNEEGEQEETDPLLGGKLHELPAGLRGLFIKFFVPQKYASFKSNLAILSKTRLAEAVPPIPKEKEETAYCNPALTEKKLIIWIAKDEFGCSADLMKELPKQIEISDEGAWIDENAKVHFDKENLRSVPVWKDRVYY